MTDGTDVDVIDESAVVVPAEADKGELVPADDQHPVAAEGHSHPGPRQYVLIAVVLVVLTALEVAASYMDDTVGPNYLILVLGVMAALKFFLVCAWYMHMKQDAPFFRRLFVVGMVGASIVYGIVMLVFSSTVLKS
jgi:cytochrome c oxidase subunit IV